MTLEDIDRALAAWNQRIAAIADNLMELQNDPTYQLLSGANGVQKLQLSGQTASNLLPALNSIPAIFDQFNLLQSVIERASQIRNDLPLFGREQALKEVEALLLGSSIQLSASALPLHARSLVSGVQNAPTVTPDQLVQAMTTSFATARDAVFSVSRAWDEVAHEVDAAETEIRILHTQTLAFQSNLASFEQKLEALKAQAQSDPIGARSTLNQTLRPQLEAAASDLKSRVAVQHQLIAAHEAIAKLERLKQEIAAAAAQSQTKIAGWQTPAAEDQLSSLRAWLLRVEQRSPSERAASILLGLDNWHKAAADLTARELASLHQQRAPLEIRNELRGRLNALKAKARAYGLAEEASAAALSHHAEELLYTQPTDLAGSAAALEAYERRLRLSTHPTQNGSTSTEERR